MQRTRSTPRQPLRTAHLAALSHLCPPADPTITALRSENFCYPNDLEKMLDAVWNIRSSQTGEESDALYREAVKSHSPGLPRFAATLGTSQENKRYPERVG